VLPKEQLLERAWEIARDIAMRPPIVIRNTRHLLVQNLKRAFLNELDHGLQAEMWAQRQFFPFGAGMQALDRPWDQKPWSD
jgi:enoyl-CoA hydratase/carnithine racemase